MSQLMKIEGCPNLHVRPMSHPCEWRSSLPPVALRSFFMCITNWDASSGPLVSSLAGTLDGLTA